MHKLLSRIQSQYQMINSRVILWTAVKKKKKKRGTLATYKCEPPVTILPKGYWIQSSFCVYSKNLFSRSLVCLYIIAEINWCTTSG